MNNYKEVKNLIHNDLKITKEDIKDMIEKAIQDEIRKFFNDESRVNSFILAYMKDLFNGEYNNPNYKSLLMMNNLIYDNVCSEIGKVVKENLKIKVGINKDNLELYELKEANFMDALNMKSNKEV